MRVIIGEKWPESLESVVESLCGRCQQLPEIENTPKVVYFVVPVDVLRGKIESACNALGLSCAREHEMLRVHAPRFRDFLIELSKFTRFSAPELRDILCIALNEGEDLTFASFVRLKPLQTWLSLVESQEYLDILSEKRLVVHFHPVLRSSDLTVTGYEALIRGVRRDGTLVNPGYLFELAEKTDTLFYLDRCCREVAVQEAAKTLPRTCNVFINFVPTSIYDPVFCLRSTVEWVQQLALEPSRLVFEVVESYRIADIEHLRNILDYYRANGFRVALDDVGSGYSSLNMLVGLKPDIVKIDRAIVRNIHNDALKQSVFRAIVALARESGIEVLAEGIETGEEYEFVREQVDFVQGFLFARPGPGPLSCSFGLRNEELRRAFP